LRARWHRIALQQLEQQPFEIQLTWMSIDGDSDGSTGATDISFTLQEPHRMSLRSIRRSAEPPANPSAAPPTGEDVTEIAGWDGKGDLPVRCTSASAAAT